MVAPLPAVPALATGVLAPAQVLVLEQVLLGPQLAVLARRPRGSQLLARAQSPVVLAHLVVEPAVPVELPLSRQSFSAAMAGSTPKPRATYEPVPRSKWPRKGRPSPSP